LERYICIHGHFYQPPRENPWLEEVELQDTATPFHDWNERVTAQCYGPNSASRILDEKNRIVAIVNNYSRISFNFGPTLLSWMERHHPEVYEAVLLADRLSTDRFAGHGSAMAQVYNHMIMPLATRRDKVTQVVWGIEDFRKRFARDPEGMWLPETAVDTETLEILSELGIRFTVLAPGQACRVRRLAPTEKWRDVTGEKVDPTTPYLCRLPSGRSIALFFYDGPISRDIAFGGLLSSGEHFSRRLTAAFKEEGRQWPQLVNVATDGETYGHHHQWGEMALSYCLHLIEKDPTAQLTNYGAYLAKHPPGFEAEIVQNSSWSCAHGVARWQDDCGCSSGIHPGWRQTWRKPLRQTMNWLRDRLADVYSETGTRCFRDPWTARDRYIEVILDRRPENVKRFLEEHALAGGPANNATTCLLALEMQRFAQLIFTSCGWFFDDITGIETVQILRYALRAMQIAQEISSLSLEDAFVRRLGEATGNAGAGGREVYTTSVKPAETDMLRVGAHYAISSLFSQHPEMYRVGCYDAVSETCSRSQMGRSVAVTGKTRITSRITLQKAVLSFAALHLGDHNIACGVSPFWDPSDHLTMEGDIRSAFEKGDLTGAVRLLDRHFGERAFSINHLFKDEQRKVVTQILTPSYQAAEGAYRKIYSDNYPVLNFLEWLKIPLPRELLDAAQNIVITDLERLFAGESVQMSSLEKLIADVKRFSLRIDEETLGFHFAHWLKGQMAQVEADHQDLARLESIIDVLVRILPLRLRPNITQSQNTFYFLSKKHLGAFQGLAEQGDQRASAWVRAFTTLGDLLNVKVA